MAIFEKYVKGSFDSYEDFVKNFKLDVPDNFNFAYDVMDVLAEEKPDKLAMIWCNPEGEEIKFTYKDLQYYTNKTANYFKSLGIRKGDMVMLILKRHYQFWFSILALHKLGAVAIPATHLLTAKDLVYRFNAASVAAVVCTSDGEIADHVETSEKDSPSLKLKIIVKGQREGWESFDDGIEKASEKFERLTGDQATTSKDMMLLYFTSGTSSYPKMVYHDFTYALAHIITAKYWHNVIDGGLHLTVSDTGWGKAVWGKLYGQWLCETAIFVYDYDKFVPDELLTIMSKHKITTFCAPPTIYRFFIKEDLTKYDLSSIKYCTIAGEPLNPEVYNQFAKATGHKLREGYGQTELVLTIANFPWMDVKPGSMGKPSPLYDIHLLNDKGEDCEPGEVGEISIKTGDEGQVGLFDGYYRDEEKTRSVWYDGYYHTGDTAWMDEDGYFWYVGRSDDLIKSSGYRIGPFEVESALIEHPAVLETAITGVPHPIRGQVVKATVVLAKGYTASEELKKELQEHVKRVTAPYKYPRIIEFVDELPKTISGKIRRVEIREKDQQ